MAGFAHEDFPRFIATLQACAQGIGIPEGFVPHSTFWLVAGGEVVGVSNLRHRLAPRLLREGGHIGYGVRPSRRGKRYGMALLRETLQKARERGIDRALLTCGKDNLASKKIILAHGGVFDSEAFLAEREGIVQRYWIAL